jgi:hypothetical protein
MDIYELAAWACIIMPVLAIVELVFEIWCEKRRK